MPYKLLLHTCNYNDYSKLKSTTAGAAKFCIVIINNYYDSWLSITGSQRKRFDLETQDAVSLATKR